MLGASPYLERAAPIRSCSSALEEGPAAQPFPGSSSSVAEVHTMARCPYLGLEEYRTSPFPFASASHRCYVSMPGVLVEQKEQEKYCLSGHYRSCPVFPVDSFEEMPAVEAVEIPQPVARNAAGEPFPGGTAPPLDGPEPVVSVPAREETTPVATEEIEPRSAEVDEVASLEPVVSQEESSEVPPGTRSRMESMRVGRLLPAAIGGVALLLFCAAGAVVVRFAGPAVSTVDFGALQLSSLGPALLLLLSGGSFAVATLLLVLFLLVGRRGSA